MHHFQTEAARSATIGDAQSGSAGHAPDRALAAAAAAILPRHGYQPVILLGQSWRQFMLAGGADGVIVGVLPSLKKRTGPSRNPSSRNQGIRNRLAAAA
jgi:hypothetical protein